MARRTLTFAAALAVFALPVVPAMAGGGGGCHEGTTEGAGDTVEMVRACFTPTTLRIALGDTVTFVNGDPITHNVVANGWGQPDDIGKGDAFTATFDEPGVYPYACMYHWGMTGAVVVGDGIGNGQQVHVASFGPPRRWSRFDPSAPTWERLRSPGSSRDRSGWRSVSAWASAPERSVDGDRRSSVTTLREPFVPLLGRVG